VDFSCRGGSCARPGGNSMDLVDGADGRCGITMLFTHAKLLIPQTANHHARAIGNDEKPESPAGMVKPRSGEVWWFVEGVG